MMAPKLAEAYGYRFNFYSFEVFSTEPPHVHIKGPNGIMKIWLETLEIAECKGIPEHIQNKLLKVVKDNQEKFLAAWKDLKKDVKD
ncbi:MAG: hypothetical protein AM1032_000387 [Mycoplasmataceae bacterium]|nr:MAG: hypothetical protein AM1032_000387 [Mycoplasmataceae bacterium]